MVSYVPSMIWVTGEKGQSRKKSEFLLFVSITNIFILMVRSWGWHLEGVITILLIFFLSENVLLHFKHSFTILNDR